MRPQGVESHLVSPTASSSTLRYSRNRGYALTLQQLLHTAVGCLLKTLLWPRSLAKHLHLRHGSRLAHHKCLVDLGKLQDSRRDAFDYAMPRHAAPCARSSPPLLLLLERRNPPPSPGSLASELASHNPSGGLLSFRPRRFQSWRPIHSIRSHTAAQLATKILQASIRSDTTPPQSAHI